MKQLIILITTSLAFSFCLTTLEAQIDLYSGNAIANPQTYGDKVFKSIIDGDNLMQQGLYENAIMAYDNAIAQNPDFSEALVKRAIAKHKIGREYEAQLDLKRALILNPYASSLHGFRGIGDRLNLLAFQPMELIAKPDIEYILNYYEEYWTTSTDEFSTVELDKDNINTLNEGSVIISIVELIRNEKYTEAEELLLALNTLDAIHYDLLGLIKKQQAEWQMAYDYFSKAIKRDSTYAPSYYFMSIIKTQKKQYADALSLVEKAIAFQPDLLKAHFHKAVLLKILEQPEKAIDAYESIIDEDERLTFELYVNMAITYKLLGQPLEALKYIESAFDMTESDNQPELYKLRGNIYLMIDENEKAIEDYTRAIELNNDYAEAYFNRGLANMIIYNRADACYDLQRSTELGYIDAQEKMQYFCVF